MAVRRPLVNVSGRTEEIPSGDTIPVGVLPTSGLTGRFLYGAFSINDNDDSNKLAIRWAENSAADRILNLLVNGASRTIDLSGNLTVPANAIVSGTNTGDAIVVGTTALSSGTNDRPLYQAAGVVTESTKWRFDGSDMTLIDPTAATGSSGVDSPRLFLEGAMWRTDTSASIPMKVRTGITRANSGTASYDSPQLYVDFWSPVFSGAWERAITYGHEPSYANARLKLGNPTYAGWGGIVDISYIGEFKFKDMSGNPSSMSALSFGKGSSLGYEQFYVNTYSPEIRAHFNSKILFAAGRPSWYWGDNAGNLGSEYVQSDLPISIGVGGAPTAKFHVIGTTEQVRIGYDSSNYYKTTVGSTGGVTFDAVGSGAAFTFADNVSLSGGKKLSLTHDGTNAGLRIVPVSGAPSSLSDGDIWYDSSLNKFRKRQNGTTSDMDTTAGGGGFSNFATNTFVPVSDGVDIYDSKISDSGAVLMIGQNPTDLIGFYGTLSAQQSVGWAVTNYTDRRTFDPTTDSYADFMDFVCTVVQENLAIGLLGV